MGAITRDNSDLIDGGKPFSLADITAIICARDAEPIIGECLRAAIGSGINRILLVDGNSKDGTRAIARNLGIEIYRDRGKGLGAARNFGAKLCTSNLVLFLGPDNAISRETVVEMLGAINMPRAVASSCLTVQNKNDYWSRAAEMYRKSVVKPGDARILPTPTLYNSKLLDLEPYSETRRFSDDSELFERWNRIFQGRNIVVDKEVVEIGNETLRDHLRRFSYYGISDYENFVAGSETGWTLSRKIQSLLHPLNRQYFGVFRAIGLGQILLFSPALLLFTLARYRGWLRVASQIYLKAEYK